MLFRSSFAQAVDAYTRVLDLDPARHHARAARGIARARMGAWREAAADLSAARGAGVTDVEVANSLAAALAQLGRERDAVQVLDEALQADPPALTVALNLARLLLDASDPSVRDAQRAEALAVRICDSTGNQDPRALETLAVAYASTGKRALARQAASRGVSAAKGRGDAAAAAALEALLQRIGG